MSKTLIFSYNLIREYRTNLTYIFIFGFLAMAGLYAASLYSVISHTVAMEHVENESRLIQTSVRELDSKYYELANEITPDIAAEYGLKETVVSAYITRTSTLGRAVASNRGM